MKRILSVILLLCLVIGLCPIQAHAATYRSIGIATPWTSYINIREEPSAGSDYYDQLYAGDSVIVVDYEPGDTFMEILYQGTTAYVYAIYLSYRSVGVGDLGCAGEARITVGSAALLREPDQDAEVITSCTANTLVKVRGVHKEYLYVQVGDEYGFVLSDQVTFSEDPSWQDHTNEPLPDLKMDAYIAQGAWDYCMSEGLTPEGAAGLLGNIYGESAFRPDNLENWAEKRLRMSDQEYTKAVDDGKYTREQFGDDYYGYGLCQWTLGSRKEGLYDFAKSEGTSIANFLTQLKYLWIEMDDSFYHPVLELLLVTDSIKAATDKFMRDFENPANQMNAARKQRYLYSLAMYERFTGVDPRFNYNAMIGENNAIVYELASISGKKLDLMEPGEMIEVQLYGDEWCRLEDGTWIRTEDIVMIDTDNNQQ